NRGVKFLMGTVTLELSLLAVALLCPATAMLRIGAFNIQAFGDTKMSNKEVAEIIINVTTPGHLSMRGAKTPVLALCVECLGAGDSVPPPAGNRFWQGN
uniref:Uncharacterized protein n=1 Tax=Cyanistes caeruleus TaxID=156563 RepID=A0A8C0UEV5_CYACU